MSHHQSSTASNSTQQTHHHHNPLITLASIKQEDERDDDDVVFLESVSKVVHLPEDYDPECKCPTCQLVKKLLAECTCEDCRSARKQSLDNQVNRSEEEQVVVQSTENVTHHDEVASPNVQFSFIDNDALTSEHISGNDNDGHSRSSTPDYPPRFFGDDDESENGNSSSDDVDEINNGDDKRIEQNCDDDVSDYVLSNQHSSYSQANEINQETEQSNRNIAHNDEVETANEESTESLIRNGASKSEYISGNDHDEHSRSSTPDYPPRFFDDDESESGDSSSDDDDDDEVDDGDKVEKKIDQKSNGDHDNTNSDPNLLVNSKWPKCIIRPTNMINTVKRFLCPCCNQNFNERKDVYRHYGAIHQQLKPYYCKWSECDYAACRQDILVHHIVVKHFNKIANSHVHNYIGKREANVGDIVVKSVYCTESEIRTDCRLCGRNVPHCALESHLRTHKSTGFRCIWSGCGFFYSYFPDARKHVRVDHLKMSKAQITNHGIVYQHLNRVDPDTNEATPIVKRRRKKKMRPPPEYSIKCPTCESGFSSTLKLLHHYREMHLEWKPYYCKWPNCDFVGETYNSVAVHANQNHFDSNDRQKARNYVAKREEDKSAPKDPVHERLIASYREVIRSKTTKTTKTCPKCGRSMDSGYFERHLRSHTRIRCNWSGCGAFFSLLPEAKEHLCSVHLLCTVEQSSAQQISQYLVKVIAKTGRTIKFIRL